MFSGKQEEYLPRGPAESPKVRAIADQFLKQIFGNTELLNDKIAFMANLGNISNEILGIGDHSHKKPEKKTSKISIGNHISEENGGVQSLNAHHVLTDELRMPCMSSLEKLKMIRENVSATFGIEKVGNNAPHIDQMHASYSRGQTAAKNINGRSGNVYGGTDGYLSPAHISVPNNTTPSQRKVSFDTSMPMTSTQLELQRDPVDRHLNDVQNENIHHDLNIKPAAQASGNSVMEKAIPVDYLHSEVNLSGPQSYFPESSSAHSVTSSANAIPNSQPATENSNSHIYEDETNPSVRESTGIDSPSTSIQPLQSSMTSAQILPENGQSHGGDGVPVPPMNNFTSGIGIGIAVRDSSEILRASPGLSDIGNISRSELPPVPGPNMAKSIDIDSAKSRISAAQHITSTSSSSVSAEGQSQLPSQPVAVSSADAVQSISKASAESREWNRTRDSTGDNYELDCSGTWRSGAPSASYSQTGFSSIPDINPPPYSSRSSIGTDHSAAMSSSSYRKDRDVSEIFDESPSLLVLTGASIAHSTMQPRTVENLPTRGDSREAVSSYDQNASLLVMNNVRASSGSSIADASRPLSHTYEQPFEKEYASRSYDFVTTDRSRGIAGRALGSTVSSSVPTLHAGALRSQSAVGGHGRQSKQAPPTDTLDLSAMTFQKMKEITGHY